jgi:CheY-like chemotaxis protein
MEGDLPIVNSYTYFTHRGGIMAASGRVLVVDDDKVVLQIISSILTRQSYEVFCAANVNSALDCMRLVDPDLILLDNLMPGLSGEYFIQSYQQLPNQRANIVVMTIEPYWENTDAHQAVTGYLSKPFKVNDLLNCVTKHLPQGVYQ